MKKADWVLLITWLVYIGGILAFQDLDPSGYREYHGLILFLALPLGWLTILRCVPGDTGDS